MATVTDYPVRLPSDVGKLGEETPLFTKAYSESCKTGSYLPMLKQELRLKIQNRRMLQGQPELQVKFEEAEKHPLTDREKQKLESRKRHNRESAKKCRNKKKHEENTRSKELDVLKAKNKYLWGQYHKITQCKILLTKKIMKHVRMRDPIISEEDFLTILPDLLKVRQAEKELFLKNNVLKPMNTGLQENEMSKLSPELQQESSSCEQRAMLQHNNVLAWLQQCGEIQADSVEVQPEVDVISPEVEITTSPNTFVFSCENPEINSNFIVQKNIDLQSNFALQQISEIQTQFALQMEETVVEEHDLQEDCDDTAMIYKDFPYQQTNAVLQGLDFLLSETV